MTSLNDLTGQRFGRLSVRGRAISWDRRTRWTCACACGNVIVAESVKLQSGCTQSCGCLKAQLTARRNHLLATHGMCETPEYRAWISMRKRCDPTSSNKKYVRLYSGRGITVCAEWEASFAPFFAHIGRRPTEGHSVDRIENNEGYRPGNVRWATLSEQNLNRRGCGGHA